MCKGLLFLQVRNKPHIDRKCLCVYYSNFGRGANNSRLLVTDNPKVSDDPLVTDYPLFTDDPFVTDDPLVTDDSLFLMIPWLLMIS
jgi:hypothetical protein